MDPIKLTWKGDEYVIRSTGVIPAIAAVETVATFGKLVAFFQQGEAPPATLALAYGKLLREAGAVVSDEDVYAAMFDDDGASAALDAVEALLAAMAPPKHMLAKLAAKGGATADPT